MPFCRWKLLLFAASLSALAAAVETDIGANDPPPSPPAATATAGEKADPTTPPPPPPPPPFPLSAHGDGRCRCACPALSVLVGEGKPLAAANASGVGRPGRQVGGQTVKSFKKYLSHFFLQIYVSVVDPDECRCERVVLEALAESEPELAKAEEQVGRC